MNQGLAKNLVNTKLRVLEKEISEILIKWNQTCASEMIELTKAGKIPEAEPDAITLTNLLDRRVKFENLLLRIEEKAKSPRKELHDLLWLVVIKLPQDYEPYGTVLREGSDCSCGCMWFFPLQSLPHDWGVCANEKSHRVGMLTFEHQGCSQFVNKREESEGELEGILGKIKTNYDYSLEKLAK